MAREKTIWRYFRPPTDKPRFQLAAVVAPWAAPFVIMAPFILSTILNGQSSGSELFSWITSLMFFWAVLAGYVGLYAFGFPLLHLLLRAGWLSLPTLALSGALAGVAVYYLFLKFISFLSRSSAQFDFFQALWGAALGFAVAVVFGLIAGIGFSTGRDATTRV